MHFTMVVLPAPLGPMSSAASPFLTANETESRALNLPKVFVTAFTASNRTVIGHPSLFNLLPQPTVASSPRVRLLGPEPRARALRGYPPP